MPADPNSRDVLMVQDGYCARSVQLVRVEETPLRLLFLSELVLWDVLLALVQLDEAWAFELRFAWSM
jgi:hypothetical protein